MKAHNINRRYVCENCGHDHICEVGDLGSNDDEVGLDRLSSCASSKDDNEFEGCGCENWLNKWVTNVG